MGTTKKLSEYKNNVEGTLNRVLSIGKEFDHPAVTNTEYGSDISLLEFGIILWDPNSTISEYRGITYSSDPISNLFSDIDKFCDDVKRRKREMSKILELGRSIIIFTPEPQRFGQRGNYLSEILPVENLHTIKALGKAIEFSGREPFNKFWMANKDYLAYKAYFKECKDGEPIFFIKNTQESLGVHFHKGNGNVIFIPSFLDETISKISKKKENEAVNEFIGSIIDLVSELNKGTDDYELPNWCSNYSLPEENVNRDRLRKLDEELKQIELKLKKQKDLLIELEKHKILFAGDGRALELEVARVFKELDFEVIEDNTKRADLTIKYEDKIAVVEIKGNSKSAKEKDARQLEAWVSEYYDRNGSSPKGILIINAYKNIPLDKRNENPFPDSMESLSRKREHCLLSGIQLLGIYLDCRNDPLKKKKIIDMLFNTNGVFKCYIDWSQYLEKII